MLLKNPVTGQTIVGLIRLTLATAFLLIYTVPSFSPVLADDDLQVRMLSSHQAYSPGDTVFLGLQVKVPSNYHLYGNPLGPGIGKPLEIGIDGAEEIQWLDVKKMSARKFKPSMGDWVWAYEKETFFFVRGKIPEKWAGKTSGTLRIDGLICHTSCIPVSKRIPFTVNVSKSGSQSEQFAGEPLFSIALGRASESMPLFRASQQQIPSLSMLSVLNVQENVPAAVKEVQQWDYSPVEKKIEFHLWLALIFGFLAGLILNVMPCVLPVLGIKILSFSQAAGNSKILAIKKSISFSGGMISVFMVLAALASFAKFSWGEQFQNPGVLAGIIVLIVLFALGMFDLFTIILPGSISNLEKRGGSGLLGDFFKGVFATILATPCSGPLLGATLAWALTRTPQVVFAVFASIGLGMAFPYVLFASSSRLSRLIPRPGPWMKDFKYLMGFILIGMAVYLMKGLSQEMMVATIGFCVFMVFAVVVYTRFAPWGSQLKRKALVLLIALLIGSAGFHLNYKVFYKTSVKAASFKDGSGEWMNFSSSLLRDAHANGRHVIIDFTASWCMNCQYNKIAVLNSPEIKKLIAAKNAVLIKADLTRPDPVIESLLNHLGSRSVPFLAIFPGDNPYEPVVMRDLLNKRTLGSALKNLSDL